MKRALLGSAISLAMLAGASAADLPVYTKAPPMPAAGNWTGCYIDGGGGYGLWNQDHSVTGPGGTTVTTTDGGRGWLGRVGGGCDYQASSTIVIGLLADYDFMGLNGSNSPSEVFAFAGAGTQPITANLKETGAWYVGGRIGYLVNPSFLTYVSGGYTQTRFSQSGEFQTLSGLPTGFSYSGTYNANNGWFLGGGTEYVVPFLPFQGLLWRSEYRFSSYQNVSLAEFNIATGVPTGNVETTRPYTQTVTTSLVWKFNWGR